MASGYEDGGPAFPKSRDAAPNIDNIQTGMTLRDWFAGQALAGMSKEYAKDRALSTDLSEYAYLLADAMLEARK